MKIGECFERRLLRHIEPSIDKASQSIKMAESKLKRAKQFFEERAYDACIIYAYTSMFHCARALLYMDGIQEKSHTCTVAYLRDKYGDKIPYYLINSLDAFRKERHEALYGLEYEASRRDAEVAIKDAEEFLEVVGGMLNDG